MSETERNRPRGAEPGLPPPVQGNDPVGGIVGPPAAAGNPQTSMGSVRAERDVYIGSQITQQIFPAGPARPFLAPPQPRRGLVGRDALLDTLRQRLFSGARVALTGMPGVGKTALALILAYDPAVQEHFPDGVLWVGLGRNPNVALQLAQWAAAAQAEGPPPGAAGAGIESLMRAVRAQIGTRRVLLVLDDVWDGETADAFALGGPHCAHLLTSQLEGLVARRFAGADNTFDVPELEPDEALHMLARYAPEAIQLLPQESADLVRALGGLPLALALVGHHLAIASASGQPARIQRAMAALTAAGARLALSYPQSPLEQDPNLPAGVPLSLTAVLDATCGALDAEDLEAFAALSLFPPKPNTFSEEAALAVCAGSPDTLARLVDYRLLEPVDARYAMHEVITAYAATKRTGQDAQTRFAAYYARMAQARATQLADSGGGVSTPEVVWEDQNIAVAQRILAADA
ncbi:MAG TPA: NB-ARC domain-containing protein [Chloroflexia bacterium]|nr:NB-ARC domain-containing protein [Chloroflexia bacterium]